MELKLKRRRTHASPDKKSSSLELAFPVAPLFGSEARTGPPSVFSWHASSFAMPLKLRC
ncbi:hypothetical protein SBA2_30066 [Acidobacteriia bacterium SbA2]|nr:hypothetical protein SBA2_30066 [Acidobacteriia bacterium SbA2]